MRTNNLTFNINSAGFYRCSLISSHVLSLTGNTIDLTKKKGSVLELDGWTVALSKRTGQFNKNQS